MRVRDYLYRDFHMYTKSYYLKVKPHKPIEEQTIQKHTNGREYDFVENEVLR